MAGFTKVRAERYVQEGGLWCPVCGNVDIGVTAGPDLVEGAVTMKTVCNNCGNEWEDIFTLTGIQAGPFKYSQRDGINPRRPLDELNPPNIGTYYVESDKDFVLNNIDPCVTWLETRSN